MEANQPVRPYAMMLTVLSTFARLIPHAPNFTPVGGSSLFAGARVKGWYAYLLPILVMAITDPFVGGYSKSTLYVYAAFLTNVLIGRSLMTSWNPARVGAASLLCSAQFFVISNFPSFLSAFPHTWQGFVDCYVLALPFFGTTVAGDLLYTGVIFGLYYALARTVARKEMLAVA